MNKCKDCKWWNSPGVFIDKSEGWSQELGVCVLSQLKRGIPSTRRMDHLSSFLNNDMVVHQEHASLSTGPEFGCIRWENKV